ncbi:lysophospholipid acyltransferase family protein [Myxococcota bacterium]|nr:lysophospholipid acyltransferase family protein [Myxococcota bacterium]
MSTAPGALAPSARRRAHPVTRLLEALSWLLGLLPERLVVALAGALSASWWHVLRYRRRVILENLSRAFPERTLRERRALGREATRHLVRSLLELFRIPRYRADAFEGRFRFEGLEHLEAARAAGKGALCLSGHLGSFELAVAAGVRQAGPVNLVVKPFPPPVDAFLTQLRTSSGLGVIPAAGAIRPILRALAKNETVVFVLDQNATRSIGVFVDFFGHPACTMSGLAVLALRTGAPVVAAIPYREADGTHVLRMLPAIPSDATGDHDEQVRTLTARYTRVIEDAIRAHPEQWFWTHKRWRTRPVGAPRDV